MRTTASGLDRAIATLRARANAFKPSTDRVVRDYMMAGAARLKAVTPKRTGDTARSIRVVPRGQGYVLLADAPVIDYLLQGTPKGNPGARIYPTRAKALAFRSNGRLIIVRSVRGMRPNTEMNAVLSDIVTGSHVVASRIGAVVQAVR